MPHLTFCLHRPADNSPNCSFDGACTATMPICRTTGVHRPLFKSHAYSNYSISIYIILYTSLREKASSLLAHQTAKAPYVRATKRIKYPDHRIELQELRCSTPLLFLGHFRPTMDHKEIMFLTLLQRVAA